MKKTTPAPDTPVATATKSTSAKATKKTTAKPVAVTVSKITPEASVTVEAPKTKPKAAVAPVVTRATSEVPTTTDVIEATPEAPVAAKVASKKASPKPKVAKITPTVEPEPSAALPEITMHERVGLTAGVIWHYLAERGTTPVAKISLCAAGRRSHHPTWYWLVSSGR